MRSYCSIHSQKTDPIPYTQIPNTNQEHEDPQRKQGRPPHECQFINDHSKSTKLQTTTQTRLRTSHRKRTQNASQQALIRANKCDERDRQLLLGGQKKSAPGFLAEMKRPSKLHRSADGEGAAAMFFRSDATGLAIAASSSRQSQNRRTKTRIPGNDLVRPLEASGSMAQQNSLQSGSRKRRAQPASVGPRSGTRNGNTGNTSRLFWKGKTGPAPEDGPALICNSPHSSPTSRSPTFLRRAFRSVWEGLARFEAFFAAPSMASRAVRRLHLLRTLVASSTTARIAPAPGRSGSSHHALSDFPRQYVFFSIL